MNKFKESIRIDNFIREEQKKVRLNNKLSSRQKMEQLQVLEDTLQDYYFKERERQARELIVRKDEEQWEK